MSRLRRHSVSMLSFSCFPSWSLRGFPRMYFPVLFSEMVALAASRLCRSCLLCEIRLAGFRYDYLSFFLFLCLVLFRMGMPVRHEMVLFSVLVLCRIWLAKFGVFGLFFSLFLSSSFFVLSCFLFFIFFLSIACGGAYCFIFCLCLVGFFICLSFLFLFSYLYCFI